MDWIDWSRLILMAIPLAWFGYQFVDFVRDLERRDKQSRRPPDAP